MAVSRWRAQTHHNHRFSACYPVLGPRLPQGPREDRYRSANPIGDDVLLLIEVAGSSPQLDRTVKVAKYARAGIQRYWLVDLVNNVIHDHRDPDRFQRRYQQSQTCSSGQLTVAIGGTGLRVDIAKFLSV